MDPKQLKPGEEFYEQMALGLEIEEAERSESGFVPPDEARRRSIAARAALRARAGAIEKPEEDEAPEWFEQYGMLLDNGWPWWVACYIAWEASPRIRRWPKTQLELATQILGLTSARAIATWRKKNPTIDDVIATMQAAPLIEYRADALTALARSASNPDHRNNPDRKLYFEMTGDYVPHSRVEFKRDAEDLSQLSDAELDELTRGLLKKGGSGDVQS